MCLFYKRAISSRSKCLVFSAARHLETLHQLHLRWLSSNNLSKADNTSPVLRITRKTETTGHGKRREEHFTAAFRWEWNMHEHLWVSEFCIYQTVFKIFVNSPDVHICRHYSHSQIASQLADIKGNATAVCVATTHKYSKEFFLLLIICLPIWMKNNIHK